MNAEGRDLGNFLSGMETREAGLVSREQELLGNFLSGMETKRLRRGDAYQRQPWKLP